MKKILENVGIKSEIDAINGSGFLAHPNFRSRKKLYNNTLIIGGWNDAQYPEPLFAYAVYRFNLPMRQK